MLSSIVDIRRNFGLDFVRAIAILLVLFNHTVNYFLTFPFSTLIGDISGMYGVEIFFVLSGYLIGKIFFTKVLNMPSKKTLKIFYIRRWLRTLPLYYILLAVFIIINIIFGKEQFFYLWHALFIQNFFPSVLNFFSVSWTLAIEEWFYLFLPLIAFLPFMKDTSAKKQLLGLGAIIGVVILARSITILTFDSTFDDLRKNIPLRFDSLLVGVLLAGVKLHWRKVYEELKKPAHVLVISVLLLLFLTLITVAYRNQTIDANSFIKIFGLPLGSLLIGLLFPFFEYNVFLNVKITQVPFVANIIRQISILSYSMYLIHLTIFDICRAAFQNTLSPILIMPIALVLVYLLSVFLYKYIEKPGMDLRNKINN